MYTYYHYLGTCRKLFFSNLFLHTTTSFTSSTRLAALLCSFDVFCLVEFLVSFKFYLQIPTQKLGESKPKVIRGNWSPMSPKILLSVWSNWILSKKDCWNSHFLKKRAKDWKRYEDEELKVKTDPNSTEWASETDDK